MWGEVAVFGYAVHIQESRVVNTQHSCDAEIGVGNEYFFKHYNHSFIILFFIYNN